MKKSLKVFLCTISIALSLGQAQSSETVFEEDSSLPMVYLNVVIKTGTITDPPKYEGLTHFMGKMLLRGTRARSKEQIDLELDQMGAQLGVETRAEALILRGAVLESELDSFLDLLAEIIIHPSFPEREIRKLRSETLSELLEDQSEDRTIAGRAFEKLLFKEHPYGNPIKGTKESIRKFNKINIRDHHLRLFKEELFLVVGTGDASESKVSSWAENISEKLGPGATKTTLEIPQNPPQRKIYLIDKPDRTQTQIYAGQIGVKMTDPMYFPLYLGNFAFGGGSFSSRMMSEIRVKRGWSYGAYSYYRHGTQPRSWQFWLFPASKDTPAAVSYSLDLLDQLQKGGITQSEFDFSKQSLVNSAGFRYNTPQKRIENTLLEKTLELPTGFFRSFEENIKKVTLEQVNQALREFLKSDHIIVTILGTSKNLRKPLAKALKIPENKIEVKSYTDF